MRLTLYPNSLLINKTRPISDEMFGTAELKTIVDEMFEILHEAKGVGLAGNQAALTKNIFVTAIDGVHETFINSEIIERSAETVEQTEMCLSLPGIQAKKIRNKSIKLKWKTIDGEEKTEQFEGFKAIVLQHESDHVCGKTIICELSKLKKDMLLKKSNKFVKQQDLLYTLREQIKTQKLMEK